MKLRSLAGTTGLAGRSSINPTGRPLRWMAYGLVALAVLAAACSGSTQPIVKLGLIAPFEELYRDDGYAALHAVKLAIGKRNAAGGVAGRQVALVALNDNGRPDEAARQAAKLGVDRDVLGVVGPLRGATDAAAGPVLTADGLPWLSLSDQQPGDFVPAADFVAAYRSLAGVDPTPQAVRAYDAANRLLDAMEWAGRSGPLTRDTVHVALEQSVR